MSLTNERRQNAVQTLLLEARKFLPSYNEHDQKQLVAQMDQIAFNACGGDEEAYVKKFLGLWGKAKRKALANQHAAPSPAAAQPAATSYPAGGAAGGPSQGQPNQTNLSNLSAEQQMMMRRQAAATQHTGTPGSQSVGYAHAPGSTPWQQPQNPQQSRAEAAAGRPAGQMPGMANQGPQGGHSSPSYPMGTDQLQASIASLTARAQQYTPQPGLNGMSPGAQMQNGARPGYSYPRQGGAAVQGPGYTPQQPRANPAQPSYSQHPSQVGYQQKAMTASHGIAMQNQGQGLPYGSRPGMSQQAVSAPMGAYPHQAQLARQQQALQQASRQLPGKAVPQDYLQHAPQGRPNQYGMQYQANPNTPQWPQQGPHSQQGLPRQQAGTPAPAQQAVPPQGQQYARGQDLTHRQHSNMYPSRPQEGSLYQQQQPARQPSQKLPDLHPGGPSGDYGILPASPSMQQMIHGLILNRPEAQPQQQQAFTSQPQQTNHPQARAAGHAPQPAPQPHNALQYQSSAEQFAQGRYQEQRQSVQLPGQRQPAQGGARPQAPALQWPNLTPGSQAPGAGAWTSQGQTQVWTGGFMDMLNGPVGPSTPTSQPAPWLPPPAAQNAPSAPTNNTQANNSARPPLQPGTYPTAPAPSGDASSTEQYWALLTDMQQNLIPILEPFLNRLKLTDADDPNQKKFISIKTQILPRLKISRSNPQYTNRSWTQKHVDQLALLQKQLSSYATKCIQHQEKVRQASQLQSQTGAVPTPNANPHVQGPTSHQQSQPGSFPPRNEAMSLGEMKSEKPVTIQPDMKPENNIQTAAMTDSPVVSLLSDPLPDDLRQKMVTEATKPAQPSQPTSKIEDKNDLVYGHWDIPAIPPSLQPPQAPEKVQRKRKCEDSDSSQRTQQKIAPLLSDQFQQTRQELQTKCDQINAGLPGNMTLTVLGRGADSDAAWAVQLSPTDSSLSSQTGEPQGSLIRAQAKPLQGAEGYWKVATFELADDKSLEVKNALFDCLDSAPAAQKATVAQDLFQDSMESGSEQASLQETAVAWCSAVERAMQPPTLAA